MRSVCAQAPASAGSSSVDVTPSRSRPATPSSLVSSAMLARVIKKTRGPSDADGESQLARPAQASDMTMTPRPKRMSPGYVEGVLQSRSSNMP
jgi:hypothetical protein